MKAILTAKRCTWNGGGLRGAYVFHCVSSLRVLYCFYIGLAWRGVAWPLDQYCLLAGEAAT